MNYHDFVGEESTKLSERNQLEAQLGLFFDQATEEEKNKIQELNAKIEKIQSEREGKSEFLDTDEEWELHQEIRSVLDDITIRTLGEKEAEYWIDRFDFEDEFITVSIKYELLKDFISKEDYDAIEEIALEYRDSEDMSIESASSQIEEILKKYKTLNTDVVLQNLLIEDACEPIADFKVNTDGSLTYLEENISAIENIPFSEQEEYEDIWKEIRKVLPEQDISRIQYLTVDTDGEYEGLAFVNHIDEQGKHWTLGIDPSDQEPPLFFWETIIHEYAHLLSLNETQVHYVTEEVGAKKGIFYDYELVAKEDAYINDFYNRFWRGMEKDSLVDENMGLFYVRHLNEFVSEYASTNCAEDFAESFSSYVFGKAPQTVAIQEKYDFFNEYPELVQIRDELRENLKKVGIDVNQIEE